MDDDLTGDRQAEAGRAEGALPVEAHAGTQPADGQTGDVPRHRWVCGVSYDGKDFCGWQKQPPVPGLAPSVQTTVEAALSAVAGHAIDIRCAGRTDAGVHALEQVIEFSTTAQRPPTAWVRGANAHLPDTVAVRWAAPLAPDADFDARFSARERTYWYVLIDSPVAPPLWQGRAGWTHYPLDTAAMSRAAALLEGEHDFSSFRASQCQAKSPVKTLYCARVAESAGLIRFDFHANAFLHHMIRNIVGALVYVGSGRLDTADFAALLACRSRLSAPPTFMPDGLYFVGADYPPQWQIRQPEIPEWLW